MTDDQRAQGQPASVPPVPPAPAAPLAPAPAQAPGYTAPQGPPPAYAPPPPPGYGLPQAPAPGYAPPQAPGYAAPQSAPAGYAPPQAPGYAAAPAPGYAPPQGYPAPGYPVSMVPAVPPRGLLPWALGLLILIPFPFIGGLASGIAMATSGGASRRAGGVASENARNALNWGLTYLLVSTVLLVSHFVLLFALAGGRGVSGFFPLGIPITIYFALSLLHLVLVIVGMVRASAGKVMRVPFAIPYLRA